MQPIFVLIFVSWNVAEFVFQFSQSGCVWNLQGFWGVRSWSSASGDRVTSSFTPRMPLTCRSCLIALARSSSTTHRTGPDLRSSTFHLFLLRMVWMWCELWAPQGQTLLCRRRFILPAFPFPSFSVKCDEKVMRFVCCFFHVRGCRFRPAFC